MTLRIIVARVSSSLILLLLLTSGAFAQERSFAITPEQKAIFLSDFKTIPLLPMDTPLVIDGKKNTVLAVESRSDGNLDLLVSIEPEADGGAIGAGNMSELNFGRPVFLTQTTSPIEGRLALWAIENRLPFELVSGRAEASFKQATRGRVSLPPGMFNRDDIAEATSTPEGAAVVLDQNATAFSLTTSPQGHLVVYYRERENGKVRKVALKHAAAATALLLGLESKYSITLSGVTAQNEQGESFAETVSLEWNALDAQKKPGAIYLNSPGSSRAAVRYFPTRIETRADGSYRVGLSITGQKNVNMYLEAKSAALLGPLLSPGNSFLSWKEQNGSLWLDGISMQREPLTPTAVAKQRAFDPGYLNLLQLEYEATNLHIEPLKGLSAWWRGVRNPSDIRVFQSQDEHQISLILSSLLKGHLLRLKVDETSIGFRRSASQRLRLVVTTLECSKALTEGSDS